MHHKFYCGDVRDCLTQIKSATVQCVVTSPPYWGLRDYGVTGQIGLEANPEEYLGTMVAVFREVRRVLRPDGTLWLNLGDSYYATARPSSLNLKPKIPTTWI
jgi:DNA modification methylase